VTVFVPDKATILLKSKNLYFQPVHSISFCIFFPVFDQVVTQHFALNKIGVIQLVHFVWIFAPCHFKYGFQADTQSAELFF